MPLWFSNLAFWIVQSALLVAAAGFLPYFFQIRQPRVLLVYWRTVLAITLALPFMQPWHHAHVIGLGAIAMAPDIAGSSLTPPSASPVAQWLFLSPQIIAEIFGGVILTGIAVRLAVLVLGLLKLRHFRQASSPISPFAEVAAVFEEIRHHVNARAEFRLSGQVDSPVTFGLAAPVILLPERVTSMNARFQAAIVCHELVHVRRHDWAHHLTEEIVRAAFWFHPAIAWLIARARLAREQVVDLEVVRITQARKTYLEALLEFATGCPRAAAIPAPPFLVERQLVERVALMSKEVRMSRARLIASLAAIACCLTLVTMLAARTFPLKGAPVAAQSAPAGVAQGVAGAATGEFGHAGSGGVHQGTADGTPDVAQSNIWIDTVKKGPMLRQVRGLGTLVHAAGSTNLVVRVQLPESQTAGVRPNQDAVVDTHKGLVKGHVSRISASPSNGTRSVDIALDAALPEGAGAGREVDGMIVLEKLDNVVYIGRPVHGGENTSIFLFKLVNDGTEAVRVNVRLGRSSVDAVEVLDGLSVGDKVILSDMSNWENVDRIHIR
jgi:beta-lactamase regulating signal transducer with metallopeptidase domain